MSRPRVADSQQSFAGGLGCALPQAHRLLPSVEAQSAPLHAVTASVLHEIFGNPCMQPPITQRAGDAKCFAAGRDSGSAFERAGTTGWPLAPCLVEVNVPLNERVPLRAMRPARFLSPMHRRVLGMREQLQVLRVAACAGVAHVVHITPRRDRTVDALEHHDMCQRLFAIPRRDVAIPAVLRATEYPASTLTVGSDQPRTQPFQHRSTWEFSHPINIGNGVLNV